MPIQLLLVDAENGGICVLGVVGWSDKTGSSAVGRRVVVVPPCPRNLSDYRLPGNRCQVSSLHTMNSPPAPSDVEMTDEGAEHFASVFVPVCEPVPWIVRQ
jgi:hypothetical protein